MIQNNCNTIVNHAVSGKVLNDHWIYAWATWYAHRHMLACNMAKISQNFNNAVKMIDSWEVSTEQHATMFYKLLDQQWSFPLITRLNYPVLHSKIGS